jgi:hypothetical protein
MAVERMVAEPVSLARYQASANPTTALPKMEKAWLVHKTKNFFKTVSPWWEKDGNGGNSRFKHYTVTG